MKSSCRVAVAACALCLVCASLAWAQGTGKTTVDPSIKYGKPATAEPEVDLEGKDERVAQEVTYEARRKTVAGILADLSKATGISLRAGINEQDWQVRDRKMNIFAKDVPLASLMNSIARVMKFRWSKEEKDGSIVYRLWMDRKTLLAAETQWLREQERLAQEQAERRQAMFETYSKLDAASEQDLARLKQENPYLYLSKTTGIASSLGQLFSEAPAALEALAAGTNVSLSAASLSPGAQQAAVATARELARLQSKMSGGRHKMPEDFGQNTQSLQIEINRWQEHLGGSPMAGMMLGDISITCDGQHVELPIFDPESDVAKAFGKIALRAMEEDASFEEIIRDSAGELIQVMQKAIKDDSGDPEIEHPEDPALDRKVKFKVESQRLDDYQAALSKAAEMAVVSDSFGEFGMPRELLPVGEKETTIREFLDSLTRAYHYNWGKQGSIVEFRDRNWFRKRAAQLPEAWLAAWRETLKNNGTLEIDDLAQIAALSQEQLQMNILADDVLRAVGAASMRQRELLRVYGALTEGQRAALFSETGLDLKTLSPDQWQLVSKLVSRRDGSFLSNPDAALFLFAKRTPVDTHFSYEFRLQSTEVEDPLQWQVDTPTYREPPAPEPQKKQADEKPTASTGPAEQSKQE